MEKYGRAGQAIVYIITGRTRVASWITKDTNPHSEHVILFFFSTTTIIMRTRLSVTFIWTLPVVFELC